ncbi:hypothetical protein WJX75_001542 [Coccomyxa subellipsoidea]|uniref:Uncharacterized protein n=1 Tax=Coccomyxa subellipsoidea TaxID=248742 RepID=A0ABR2YQT0_9CHLO
MARYKAKLDEAAAYSKQTVNSTQAWYEAADEVREAKTWFWRFTRQRPVVLEKLANERAAYAIVFPGGQGVWKEANYVGYSF